jgi:SAM-dependent methyltransferase
VFQSLAEELRRSGYGAPGFAARYDAYRPRPPAILLDLLPFLAHADRPALVVDLGSGTGLSTRFWAERADAVLGVEPNPQMRRHAESVTVADNIRYVDGSGERTGLADGCADIVTCAQSLHWMEPDETVAEVARILRPGGVFAAYNYRSLVTGSWEVDHAVAAVRTAVRRLRHELALDHGKRHWPVSHERLERSGLFRFVTETSVHSVETGDADRVLGFLLSEGSVTTLLEHVDEQMIGLDRVRATAQRTIGSAAAPWYLGYGVWLGVT